MYVCVFALTTYVCMSACALVNHIYNYTMKHNIQVWWWVAISQRTYIHTYSMISLHDINQPTVQLADLNVHTHKPAQWFTKNDSSCLRPYMYYYFFYSYCYCITIPTETTTINTTFNITTNRTTIDIANIMLKFSPLYLSIYYVDQYNMEYTYMYTYAYVRI